MSRITILVVASVAAISSMTHALEINLSGQVIDVKRNPVPDAIVRLSRAGMSDTTDQTGAFVLSGTTGARFRSGNASWDALTPLFDGAYVTFMAPVKRFTQLLGNASYAITYGLGRAAVELLACALFFGISLRGANFFTAAVVLVVSSLPFLGMGLAAAVLPLLSRERGSQAAHIFQALVLLVSGVYYDVKYLPAWLRPLSDFSPATYTLRAMRSAILDGANVGDVWREIVILAVSGVILIPLGFMCFSLGERWAKRTGKLKIEG